MRITDIRHLAEDWQDRLGLSEWDIQVNWGKPSPEPNYARGEMDIGTVGIAHWHAEEGLAWIYLLRSGDKLEETLVHEMLHIRLEGHRAPVKYSEMYERGINAIAKALVAKY